MLGLPMLLLVSSRSMYGSLFHQAVVRSRSLRISLNCTQQLKRSGLKDAGRGRTRCGGSSSITTLPSADQSEIPRDAMADRRPHDTPSSWNAYEQSSAPVTGAAANQHYRRRSRSNGNDAGSSRSGNSRGGHEPARNRRYPPVDNSRADNNNSNHAANFIRESGSANREQVVHHRAREARKEFQVLLPFAFGVVLHHRLAL